MAKMMQKGFGESIRNYRGYPVVLGLFLPLFAFGCASPGPPRSPSLNEPEVVKVVEIQRVGSQARISFRLPQRNTDHLPLKGKNVTVTLCRSIDNGKCVALPETHSYPIETAGQATEVLISDDLGSIAQGMAGLVSYRIDLKDVAGHSAGYSEPFFTTSAPAPSAISQIHVDGSRLGVVIFWDEMVKDGHVVVHREPTYGGPKPEPVDLAFPAEGKGQQLLDTSALAEVSYRYSAEVRKEVTVGGRTFVVRSAPSAPVMYVLHDVYPPPVPVDLTAAAFPLNRDDALAGFGVDLIWQPVQSPRLKGYVVYRQLGDGTRARVTQEPVAVPAFHDELRGQQGHVTYSVSAIDAKGNESGVVSTTVDVAAQ